MNDALIYISSISLGKVQQKILKTKFTQFGGSVVKKAKEATCTHVLVSKDAKPARVLQELEKT